jgi:hypothetical protein
MGERVLMWGEDSYDDTLTAKQESQDTHVAALAKGLQGGHMSPLPVEFNVVVTFNEKSSFYLKASGIELEKTTTPTNSPINVGRIEADICLNKNVIEEEYVPYNIRWRIGCMTGKMVLAFDPKTSIQEGICNTVQAVYNPNLRLSHQEYTARPYEHLAWDRDIDNQVDCIYEKYWEKLIADVRHASRQINTILKMNKQPQETRQTNPTGMMASHISVIEQWIMSILDTRNEPSVKAIVQSPGYLETWGATRFLLHEKPIDTMRIRMRQGNMPSTTTIIALFWEDYGWIGPLTEQETRDVTATLILHNKYITLTESDTSHHIMFKKICHRAGYLSAVLQYAADFCP